MSAQKVSSIRPCDAPGYFPMTIVNGDGDNVMACVKKEVCNCQGTTAFIDYVNESGIVAYQMEEPNSKDCATITPQISIVEQTDSTLVFNVCNTNSVTGIVTCGTPVNLNLKCESCETAEPVTAQWNNCTSTPTSAQWSNCN